MICVCVCEADWVKNLQRYAGRWHAILVVWKKCITGSFSWAECTANITHNECSVTGGTGQEHLLQSFVTDQNIGDVASKAFSLL